MSKQPGMDAQKVIENQYITTELSVREIPVCHSLRLHSLSSRITIKLDRLIVLSKSSLLGWFLHVSLILIIKGRSPMEVSLIVIINQV